MQVRFEYVSSVFLADFLFLFKNYLRLHAFLFIYYLIWEKLFSKRYQNTTIEQRCN